MTPIVDHRLTLLDLISTRRRPDVGILSGIDRDGWERIDAMACEHRLRPLLHARARDTAVGRLVPPDLVETWRAAYHGSAKRLLTQRAELGRVYRLLSAAGIACVVLKGGALPWRAPWDPVLRPLRDLDILVGPERVFDAYAILLGNGFDGPPPPRENEDKHLPGLTSTALGVYVELHARLCTELGASANAVMNAMGDAALARVADLPPSDDMPGLAPTEALLHLIVHAALDHRFDNGPLVLRDIAMLVDTGAVDWPLLYARTVALDCRRACALMLRLADRYEGPLAIDEALFDTRAVPDAVMLAAARMMLVDLDRRGAIGVAARLAPLSMTERLRRLIAATRLSRRVAVAASDRGPLRTHLAWAVRIAGRIGATVVRPAVREQSRTGHRVARWLAGAD